MKNGFQKFAEGLVVPDEHPEAEAGDWQSGLADLDASCREASREMEHLSVWQHAQQKALKSQFNVFTAVLKYDDEVKLHSRWLHYLLNPKGEHDCDSLFLKLFLETLRQEPAQQHKDDDPLDEMVELETITSESVEVIKEHHTAEFGNLDILIECPGWGVIVIENKTRLDEGNNQLRDYAKYCIRRCSHVDRKFILLYLTPEGDPSQSAHEHKDKYRRISYRKHILLWLEKCLRATYPYVHINQALQQYRNVVNQLLNISSDNAYMNGVKAILKKHRVIIKHRDDINQAIAAIRQDYWESFVPELRKQLAELGITLGQKTGDKHYSDFELETSRSFQRNSYTELRTTFEYWEDENCLLIGETVCPPDAEIGREFQETKAKFARLIKRLENEFPQAYDSADANEGWPLGWAYLLKGFMLPEFLAERATQDSRPMSELVGALVRDISRYFKVLEKAWPRAAA